MPKHAGLGLLVAAVLLFRAELFPVSIAAQGAHAIEVQANKALVQFPNELAFHLEILAPSPSAEIELEYEVDKVSCSDASVRIKPDLTEEEQTDRWRVSVDWTWDFRKSGSLPPGARIWWRWHVTTEDGETLSTPAESVSFDDDRHKWQTSSQGQITVHWYDGDEAFGREMLQTSVEAQARLTRDPGAGLERPVNLYFYATPDDLREALVFSQRWTGGLAFPAFGTILIAADPDSQTYGRRTVAHELMHLVVHQLSFNCWSDLPSWLDEGLASWAEGDLEAGQQKALDKAIAEDSLLSLRSLNSAFSAHTERAHLSYAQSYSVVDLLIREYGREAILELLAVFREGATYDGALLEIYGFDTDGLEDLWRAEIGAQPRTTASASAASRTPMPTLVPWSQEPTTAPPTDTPLPTVSPQPNPSLLPPPVATATPPATEVAAVASPTVMETREPSAGPTPIGGTLEDKSAEPWVWYAVGAGGLIVGLVVVIWTSVRRRAPRARSEP